MKYKKTDLVWCPEIPNHWHCIKLKYLALGDNTLFLDGDWIESKDIVFEGDIRYITTGNIGEGVYKEQGGGHILEETFERLNCTEVYPGDLLISRLNAPIGRCCIIPDLGKRIVTSVDNVIFRPAAGFLKKYLMYVMSNNKYFEYTDLISRGVTMQRISRSMLGDIKIPLTLDMAEQKKIVDYLDLKIAEIDNCLSVNEKIFGSSDRKSGHLLEYRSAIISEVTTGQIFLE